MTDSNGELDDAVVDADRADEMRRHAPDVLFELEIDRAIDEQAVFDELARLLAALECDGAS